MRTGWPPRKHLHNEESPCPTTDQVKVQRVETSPEKIYIITKNFMQGFLELLQSKCAVKSVKLDPYIEG
jgi:hypothetical protein